ncbi:hypothetical protein [Rhizobium leguminosarum]|uniref:hypothetical protein n=1 Tax=Rhizobium leguminosarum TaxID=384 RepID=UPI002E13CC43|nr:hypothetical protein U8Q02_41035 [Rhizobium leguminosarum]
MRERIPPFDGTLSQAQARLEDYERAVVDRVRYEASPERDGEGLGRVAKEYERTLTAVAEVLRLSCD